MGGKSTTSTSTTSLPPEMRAAYKNVVGKSQSMYDKTSYSPFAGGTTNPLIDSANETLGGAGMAGQGAFGMAQGDLAGATTPAYQNVGNYMNPYTSGVVNATMANMRENDASQQQGVIGNAIAKGAMGGDRVGVAQAELARQQGLSDNQTIAGLWNQNYSQAMAAQQADQAQRVNAANSATGLGTAQTTSDVQAGLAGLQGGENQYNRDYAQYQSEQSYPFQKLSWLSSIVTGLGQSSGGTTTSTQPSGNGASSLFGGLLGLGSMLMSDARAKEDISPVGKTFDGQTLYRFRYKGEPAMHVGLIAQEVEQSHPESVAEAGGMKHVDYRGATDAAVHRGHFLAGGGVIPYSNPVPGAPGATFATGEDASFIPPPVQTGGGGNSAPKSAGDAPQQDDASSLLKGAQGTGGQKRTDLGNKIHDSLTNMMHGTGVASGAHEATAAGQGLTPPVTPPVAPPPVIPEVPIIPPILSRGGVVRGYDGGGLVDDGTLSLEDIAAKYPQFGMPGGSDNGWTPPTSGGPQSSGVVAKPVDAPAAANAAAGKPFIASPIPPTGEGGAGAQFQPPYRPEDTPTGTPYRPEDSPKAPKDSLSSQVLGAEQGVLGGPIRARDPGEMGTVVAVRPDPGEVPPKTSLSHRLSAIQRSLVGPLVQAQDPSVSTMMPGRPDAPVWNNKDPLPWISNQPEMFRGRGPAESPLLGPQPDMYRGPGPAVDPSLQQRAAKYPAQIPLAGLPDPGWTPPGSGGGPNPTPDTPAAPGRMGAFWKKPTAAVGPGEPAGPWMPGHHNRVDAPAEPDVPRPPERPEGGILGGPLEASNPDGGVVAKPKGRMTASAAPPATRRVLVDPGSFGEDGKPGGGGVVRGWRAPVYADASPAAPAGGNDVTGSLSPAGGGLAPSMDAPGGGTWKAPASANMEKVDPRLVEIMQTAAYQSGMHVEVTPHGGDNPRSSGTQNHPTGRALDIQLYDANGKALGNYQDPQTFGQYEKFAQLARKYQQDKYPDLSDAFRWGGYFGGKYAKDQMHFDLSGGLSPGTPVQSWGGSGAPIGQDVAGNQVQQGTGPGGLDFGRAQGAIKGLESAGRYDIMGVWNNAHTDRPYGAYQVMGANIPDWTKKYFGQSLTPDQFLRNPAAQDAVFNGEFGRLAGKYGPEGAAQAWLGGSGSVGKEGRSDSLGTTVGNYGKKFMEAYGAGGGGGGSGTAVAGDKVANDVTGTIGSPQGGGILGKIRDTLGGRDMMSDDMRLALFSAGMGMMAGKSGNAFQNIGEGALRGVEAYQGAKKLHREDALAQSEIGYRTGSLANEGKKNDLEGQRLAQQADIARQQLAVTTANTASEIASREAATRASRYTQTPIGNEGILTRDTQTQQTTFTPYEQMVSGDQGAPGAGPAPPPANVMPQTAPADPGQPMLQPSPAPGAGLSAAPPAPAGQPMLQPPAPVDPNAPPDPNAPFPAAGMEPPVGKSPFNKMTMGTAGQGAVAKLFDDRVTKLRDVANAAQTSNVQLDLMEQARAKIPEDSWVANGSGAQTRTAWARAANTYAQMLGHGPVVDPEQVAASEEMIKGQNSLGFALAKTLGSREAGFIVQQAVNTVPGASLSREGSRLLIAATKAANQRSVDNADYIEKWGARNGGDLTGAQQAFDRYCPPSLYALMAVKGPDVVTAVQRLRANPASWQAFDKSIGMPGAARMALGGGENPDPGGTGEWTGTPAQ